MSYTLFFPYSGPYWLLIWCLWPQTCVQERMSLSPLQELPLMVQGLFFLLPLGNGTNRLYPPQGWRCLGVFLETALCLLLVLKPNTLKMEHFLYDTLNSLSPWCYSLTTCLVCEWILIKAWHKLEAGPHYWALFIVPSWLKFCYVWLGSTLKEISPSVSSASPGLGEECSPQRAFFPTAISVSALQWLDQSI